ncbi:hypothetical protein CYMTET_12068 [Cymbomonas tetramitiformis]|uniref:F5/8 type C domain-containing protein n=1 Tax=Cymbomonas tetramitiformis TaxID=36881 RepID=A0AAE0GLC7_9CHLO|nr:hypothetical protein CYMTET_12068 [Cymbomonas tetramitiformis]
MHAIKCHRRSSLFVRLCITTISLVSSAVTAGQVNYALKSLGATANASGESCFNGFCSRADQVLEEGVDTFWAEWLCTPSNQSTPVWLLVDLGQQRSINSIIVRGIVDIAYTVQDICRRSERKKGCMNSIIVVRWKKFLGAENYTSSGELPWKSSAEVERDVAGGWW